MPATNCQIYTIEVHKTIESTQTYLIEKVKSGIITNNHIVLAHKQTSGIGRSNTSWMSFEGCLTFSIAVFSNKINTMKIITYICHVLNNQQIDCFIKWPNDIHIKDKKICGILIDKIDDVNVIGIGINIRNQYGHMCSIETLTEQKIDRLEFIDELMHLIMEDTLITKNYFKMPNYIVYKNTALKFFKQIEGELHMMDEEKNIHIFSSNEYSFDIQNNEITKKY